MRRITAFFMGALLGGLTASLLALLLTPYSGMNLRSKVIDRFGQIRSEVQQAAQQRRLELERELSRLRTSR